MPQLQCNAVALNFVERGEGEEAMVFSHGLLWDWQMWEPQLQHFAPRFRCLAYDHRGQGESGGGPGGLDLDQLCEDAAAFIRQSGAGPCHFVGLSMGGFVGLRLAARHPELVRSLVLLDTSAEAEDPKELRRLRWMVRVLTLFGARPLLNQVLKKMFGRSYLADPARATELNRWRERVRQLPRSIRHPVRAVIERREILDELSKIRCPTLVLVGAEDETTPPACAQRIAERIADARLIELPRVGHMSSLEAPRQVNAVIDAFLSTMDSGGPRADDEIS